MLVFLDIDGTLTDMRGMVPPSTVEALKGAREKGNRLIISSGRSMCEIYPHMRESGLFSGYVAGAGAYVELDGQILRDRPMPQKMVVRVMEWMQEVDADFICECNDFMYEYRDSIRNLIEGAVKRLGEGDRERIEANYGRIVRKFATRHFSHDEAVRFAQAHKVNKFLYYHCDFPLEEMKKEIPGCRILPSSFLQGEGTTGEISEEGVTKADGIKLVCDALGLPVSQTIAFGDSANDIEMLSAAGTSVAMGNSSDEVKRLADYVTGDYDKDGILDAFRHFGLC